MVFGPLYKKKSSFVPTLQRWKKLFFCLEPHESSLFVYESEGDMERKWYSRRVAIKDMTEVKQCPFSDKEGCRFDLTFLLEVEESELIDARVQGNSVTRTKKKWRLCALTAADANQWVEALQMRMQGETGLAFADGRGGGDAAKAVAEAGGTFGFSNPLMDSATASTASTAAVVAATANAAARRTRRSSASAFMPHVAETTKHISATSTAEDTDAATRAAAALARARSARGAPLPSARRRSLKRRTRSETAVTEERDTTVFAHEDGDGEPTHGQLEEKDDGAFEQRNPLVMAGAAAAAAAAAEAEGKARINTGAGAHNGTGPMDEARIRALRSYDRSRSARSRSSGTAADTRPERTTSGSRRGRGRGRGRGAGRTTSIQSRTDNDNDNTGNDNDGATAKRQPRKRHTGGAIVISTSPTTPAPPSTSTGEDTNTCEGEETQASTAPDNKDGSSEETCAGSASTLQRSARKQSVGTAGGRRKASLAIAEAVSASALGRQRKASRGALQPGVVAALARAETTPAENLVVSIDDILGNAPSAAAASVKRDALLGGTSLGSGSAPGDRLASRQARASRQGLALFSTAVGKSQAPSLPQQQPSWAISSAAEFGDATGAAFTNPLGRVDEMRASAGTDGGLAQTGELATLCMGNNIKVRKKSTFVA